MSVFIDSLSFRVGEERELAELFEGPSGGYPSLQFYSDRGLKKYCCQSEPTNSYIRSVILDSLGQGGRTGNDIGAVLLSSATWSYSQEEEVEILSVLADLGIRDVPVVSIGMQACSGMPTTLGIAAGMLNSLEAKKCVLISAFGRVLPGNSRIGVEAATVFSDGAAACLVTAREGKFELLAANSRSSASIDPKTQTRATAGNRMRLGYANIRELTSKLYSRSGTDPSHIFAMFCTNGNSIYNAVAAEAAKVSREKVYEEDLGRFAHVHTCDHVIGLRTFEWGRSHRAGDVYLLLGWSQNVYSGAVIRCT